MHKDERDAEEECLFFVAMSRARDVLSLTHAQKYTEKRKSNPSKFLEALGGLVTNVVFMGSGKTYARERELVSAESKDIYTERELEIYTQCPARYRDEYVDRLRGGGDESAYIRFHRCVYKKVGWLETEHAKGNAKSEEDALTHLAKTWEEDGPVGHAFEKFHRKNAEVMVRTMTDAIVLEDVTYERDEWLIAMGRQQIQIFPDRVLIGRDGSVRIQRIRTGKKTKSESGKRIYALLRKGAQQKYPGRRISVEAFYLATGEVLPMPTQSDDKLVAEYAEAIAGIERGAFHAVPEARRCPNCPSYFICTGA